MRTQPTTLPILAILAAVMALPLTATAEVCRLDFDAPALVTVEAEPVALSPTRGAGAPVLLEASPSHLVLAVRQAGTVSLQGPAGCRLSAGVTRIEIQRQTVTYGDLAPAVVTTLRPLTVATKEEDHDFDPDPGLAALPQPLLTLIELGGDIATKEEDHDFDPDPKSAGIPTKEEDHDFDPDPGLAADGPWADDWDAASAVVRQLGPGWYFVVRDDRAIHEILIEAR